MDRVCIRLREETPGGKGMGLGKIQAETVKEYEPYDITVLPRWCRYATVTWSACVKPDA